MNSYAKRIAIFIYGVLSYAIFLATFVYSIGFVGNLPFAARTIDAEPLLPFWQALSIDVLLLGLFAVQHGVMTGPAFKRWWMGYLPVAAQRSSYLLCSSLVLILLYAFWQPLGGEIWQIDNHSGRLVLAAAFGFGWALLLYSTVLIDHFDLFGLRQVGLQLLGKPYTALAFETPEVHQLVRHTLYAGGLLCCWATPSMTATHLLFAVLTSVYVLIAIQLEERDLVAVHPESRDYRRHESMLLPRLSRRSKSEASGEAV